MKDTIKATAYAKVNLYLDIVGIRDNGYHLLEMVMQSVSLADELVLSSCAQEGIAVSLAGIGEEVPADEANTCHRAATLFCKTYRIRPALQIALQKRIPTQAGLGGGSADAAAVLLGLNSLYNTQASLSELCKLGEQVGADVPFCLQGGTAVVQGIGEIITPVTPIPPCFLVIAKPAQGISTPEAFRCYDALKAHALGDKASIVAAIIAGDVAQIGASLYNAFYELLPTPSVRDIIQMMQESGAVGSTMSGTGSACFGVFESKMAAKRCYRKLVGVAQSVYLAKPVEQGVLLEENYSNLIK